MESSKHLVPLVPVVMMSVTALASALPAQASQLHPSASQLQQEAVPVILATAVYATSTEPEQLIQYRLSAGIDSEVQYWGKDKWPDPPDEYRFRGR